MTLSPELVGQLVLAFIGSGIGASLVTEAVSFLNKKLTDTPLHGAGALVVSAGVAFLTGALQVYVTGIPSPQSLNDIAAITTAVWVTSQAFFHVVLKRVDALHVTPDDDSILL
jgi:hypothetical protein